MKFTFHASAELELDKAVQYYEECRRGLGLDFASEVRKAIERISQFPNAWTSVSKNARRCLVKRFPFGIIYRIKNDTIEVIAIADMRRRPGYWQDL